MDKMPYAVGQEDHMTPQQYFERILDLAYEACTLAKEEALTDTMPQTQVKLGELQAVLAEALSVPADPS